MRKVILFLIAVTVFCLFAPLSMAEKGGKNPGGGGGHNGGGGGTTVTTQLCDMDGIVQGTDKEVGVDGGTYGPAISLYLNLGQEYWNDESEQLPAGDYFGVARVLKGATSSRLDFYFATDTGVCDDQLLAPGSGCEYVLTLLGGVYSAANGDISFAPEEYSTISLTKKVDDLNGPESYKLLIAAPGRNKHQAGRPQELVGSATISNFTDVADSQP